MFISITKLRANSKNMREKNALKITGQYIIRKYKAGTKELLWESPVYKNLVVASDGYGKNILVRQIGGNTTYAIGVDSAAIGTGTNAPAASDTGLQTPVLSGIDLSSTEFPTSSSVTLSFFITDAQLANGTYTEFGIFMNLRLFARSLFSIAYTKGTGEDTTIDYTITIT